MVTWKRNMMAGGLALTISGIANAQAPAPAPAAAPARPVAAKPAGDLPGPIDNLNDLEQTGRMVFKVADTNNDGQISKKEAVDAGNLLVGGFFFRADQNGDGTLSQDEAKQAREALFAQQPLLRYVLTKGKMEVKKQAQDDNNPNATKDPAKAIGDLLDINNDKQIQASEVRQAVQTSVESVYAVADTNRDGQMSPTEINSAIIGFARTAAQAAFQQADEDRNGTLSRAEFDKAIVEPANVIFGILDGNNDGQISPDEAQKARRLVAGQLRGLMVPEPANSIRNLIRTGAAPEQIAPVPNVPASAVTPRQ